MYILVLALSGLRLNYCGPDKKEEKTEFGSYNNIYFDGYLTIYCF